jgi:hypothetical protein
MAYGLADNVKVVRVKPDGSGYTVAAGTAAVTSDPVDTSGFACCTFVLGFGAIVTGGVQSMKVQQGAASNMSDGADLTGSAQTVADTDDSKCVVSEIVFPQERYLRVITSRATQNSTIDFLLAILSGPGSRPVTSDTTVLGREVASSPIEGTA